ncbi:MAG TPA: aminoacyl--tRNA ligase-related protein, partial [Gemmatimonadaceae bacterium]|nr:aminoacyl--tRNA ligase-related protein [Gemmatimonadaceae bacterium]
PAVTPRRQSRNRAGISVRRSSSHAEPVAELIHRGEIEVLEGGEIRFHESALALSWYLDNVVRAWARELGATETESPEAIKLETLERAGFVEAFPQKLVRSSEPGRALSPAVCYHAYPRLAGKTVEGDGSLTTTVGRCFREESDDDHPLERLRAFTMREIIVVGGPAVVEHLREEMMDRVSAWVEALGLDGYIEPATDPFFTSESRGRMLAQQILPLKYELRLAVGGSGRTVAASSFNDHQQHFGRAFDIRRPDGEAAHSGCVAFGWERWVLAFVSQHGPDARNWPDAVRSHLPGSRPNPARSAHAHVA